jgi:hypothetical protein
MLALKGGGLRLLQCRKVQDQQISIPAPQHPCCETALQDAIRVRVSSAGKATRAFPQAARAGLQMIPKVRDYRAPSEPLLGLLLPSEVIALTPNRVSSVNLFFSLKPRFSVHLLGETWVLLGIFGACT